MSKLATLPAGTGTVGSANRMPYVLPANRPVADWLVRELEAYVGGLSKPSKMPCHSYSLPAAECSTGGKLQQVEGSTCHDCYALKGMYRFPVVQDAMYRRLESITKPQWVEAMAELIIRKTKPDVPYFRWHDSGDLQSGEHFANIIRVCELTPNIQHWIPTREYRIVAVDIRLRRQHSRQPQRADVSSHDRRQSADVQGPARNREHSLTRRATSRSPSMSGTPAGRQVPIVPRLLESNRATR